MPRLHTLLVTLLVASPALAADEPFLDLSFEVALARAQAAGKLLLVDVVAEGHGACAEKDAPIWQDTAVRRWIAERAVAIQVDAHTAYELVDDFQLEDFPTVILLRDGHELDRHMGCMEAADFVAWVDAALAGRTENAVVAARVRALLTSDDFEARAGAAFDAVGRHDDDPARQHLLWLWQHADHDEQWAYLRISDLPQEMAQVAKRDETARKAFLAILDGADARMQAGTGVPDLDRWREWVALCMAFDQPGRIATWYEKHRDKGGRLFQAEPPSEDLDEMRDAVFGVLMDLDRPVEAVGLLPDLHPLLHRVMDEYSGIVSPDLSLLSDDDSAPWRSAAEARLRQQIAIVHAGLLGAGRTDEASDWAAALLQALDDAESRIELVRMAVKFSSARPVQLGVWLDEASAKGADVKDLRAKLAASGEPAK